MGRRGTFLVMLLLSKQLHKKGAAPLAKIIQQKIFSWEDVEASGELERLRMVIEALDDDELMEAWELERKGRRDDYPIRPVWNSILGGIVYQHARIESLRRELLGNGEVREACGFDPAKGAGAVPSKDAYSSMLKKLIKKHGMIEEMLHALVDELKQYLPDFGRHVGIDSKKRESYARGKKDSGESSDPEAHWGSIRPLGAQGLMAVFGRRSVHGLGISFICWWM